MAKNKLFVTFLLTLCHSAAAANLDQFSHLTRAGKVSDAEALHIAAIKDEAATIDLLLSRGADVNAARDGSNVPPLLTAVNANAIHASRVLLERGADVQRKTLEGETALHLAAGNGGKDVASLLLDYSVDINAGTRSRATALYFAVQAGHIELATLLLERRAETEISTSTGVTPLLLAARKGTTMLVELLLHHGSSVHHAAQEGSTALHLAANKGHVETGQALLAHWAPIEALTSRGASPLLSASQNNQTAFAIMLLHHGADVHVRSYGESFAPLHYAAGRGNVLLAQQLIEHGADANMRVGISGEVPLHLAAMHGHTGVVEVLLNAGAAIDKRSASRQTPLLLATISGNSEVMGFLIAQGATPSAVWRLQSSALHEASAGGDAKVVGVLLDHLSNQSLINLPDIYGDTPLHWAASAGANDAVQLLLAQRAEVDTANRWGDTPLHSACFNGHVDTVRLLLASGSKQGDKADHFGDHPSQLLEFGQSAESIRHQASAKDKASLPADLPEEWQVAALEMLMPSERQLLLYSGGSADVSPDQLIAELAIQKRSLTYDRKTRSMLHSRKDLAMLEMPGALNEAACLALRKAVDNMPSLRSGTTDGMPEHTLHLERSQLQQLIGVEAVDQLWRLPALFQQQVRRASGTASEWEQPACDGGAEEPAIEMEIFVRKFSLNTRPWIKMHADVAGYTVNVALSDESDQTGGRLLGVYDHGIHIVERRAGDATVHPSTLLHGVTRMRGADARYSLIIFFQ